ncbi:MAG: AraC family transcriptional regulator [Rhodobacteraceae bacterium]|nr:AraC family transcriptional regulator [Paracoccaceae bacterium]
MDRLTTLIERFHLTVRIVPVNEANMIAFADATGQPSTVVFHTRTGGVVAPEQGVLFAAVVDWSGASNPLLASLPEVVELDLTGKDDTRVLVSLMHQEAAANRCGGQSVVNRLGEALMVRVLRDQIERGATEIGLLAGLADARLSRAIVSMHDHPGRLWTNADLATVAGLSLSRFSELFAKTVGETPMGYLRRWRLILARQDVLRGDRIERVAHRYAYASPESFTRAFRQRYGASPSRLRGD